MPCGKARTLIEVLSQAGMLGDDVEVVLDKLVPASRSCDDVFKRARSLAKAAKAAGLFLCATHLHNESVYVRGLTISESIRKHERLSVYCDAVDAAMRDIA